MVSIVSERRSTADIVFQQLRDQIMSLEILPGTKLSEAEVAERFGVSRQPVREAFNLLGNLDLLMIRPQKASRIRLFSNTKIEAARFARLAIELEVAKRALQNWSNVNKVGFERSLEAQETARVNSDSNAFHQLDYDFHKLITEAAQTPFAFDQIMHFKSHVDRICVLSLKDEDELDELVTDHREIYDCLMNGDGDRLEMVLRAHLSRIDKTIEGVYQKHPDYFSD